MADQPRFSLPKLNNQNYQSWKFKIEMLLIRDELWHVISQPKPEPVTAAWTKADLKARATIGLCIEDNQTSLIRNCTNAQDAWKALKDYHDKVSDVYLLKKLTRLELGENGDMEQHLQQFTDLLQRIADAGEAIPVKWQVAMLLCSLPDTYDPLTTALEQRPRDELTLDLVKSKLLAEAEKRRERNGTASVSGEKALRTEFRKRVSVLLADGVKAEAIGSGQGSIVGVNGAGDTVEIVLRDVLFVPKLTSGLISVSTLASKDFHVVFTDNRCEIRNQRGEVSAVATRRGNLYGLCTPEQAMISVQSQHTVNCQHTWHRRLGHRDPDVIRVISANGHAEGMKLIDCGLKTICRCCLEGKMARAPFKKQVARGSKERLDIVHTDLSGPMISTPSGNKYFLILIDDFTRMAFLYLLKAKSEAASKIKRFCTVL
ncbi:uncharacterized protein LOC129717100 [Wyeomyia smithii]|uniref:uncharacterized protein LOC129717100 n=1 Tax=Wyeomyia smithii TaxID=174621 RepID=UPI0024680EF3|nr:uncharacterized protein LOC129717100 [Wyeomyia smithii]